MLVVMKAINNYTNLDSKDYFITTNNIDVIFVGHTLTS